MAETDFILAENEQAKLIEFILARNAVIVPSLRYLTNKIRKITILKDVMDVIASDDLEGPLLILKGEFSKYPLQIKSLVWRGETRYFIEHRYGGPYLEMLPSSYRTNRDTPLLTSGFIAYYKSYYTGQQWKEVIPPLEMKEFYRSITQFIRRNCKKYDTEKVKRAYFIGPQACQMIRQGVEINVQGLKMSEVDQ